MADLRCRWCGDYLLPARYGGNGEPFCSDVCCVASLERTIDFPSISPLIPGFPQANGTVLSAPMPYNGGTGDDCESSRSLAHSPHRERTTR